MATVIGLDPSLTGFGVCRLSDDSQYLATIKSGSTDAAWADRVMRYKELADAVAQAILETEHPVFIEAYSLGSKNSRAHTTGEFGCYLRLKVTQTFKVPIVEVTPGELKKWVLGKGLGSKAEIVSALSVRTGVSFKDDNQADAYGIAELGRCVLGIDPATTKPKKELVAAIRKRNGLPVLS